jgi:hypothetical protein
MSMGFEDFLKIFARGESLLEPTFFSPRSIEFLRALDSFRSLVSAWWLAVPEQPQNRECWLHFQLVYPQAPLRLGKTRIRSAS